MEKIALDNVESDSDDGSVSKLTWNKLQNACHSQGYREGLIEGKERKLQEGFDQGYLSGFKQSQNSAEMEGFLSAVMLHNSHSLQINEKLKTVLAGMQANLGQIKK
ncbi:protein YAE1 homolog [Daphnia carinata]|uniref:protein YAE1 homolog n=1 Tax=Daphnia carinata TaxID=120202 RepID=UPI00257EAD41|nr:protein YAE1 homolog [Daphnia carinata]